MMRNSKSVESDRIKDQKSLLKIADNAKSSADLIKEEEEEKEESQSISKKPLPIHINESIIPSIDHTNPSFLLTEDNGILINFIQKTKTNPLIKPKITFNKNDLTKRTLQILSPRLSYVIPLTNRINNFKENTINTNHHKKPSVISSIHQLSSFEPSRNHHPHTLHKTWSKPSINPTYTTTPSSKISYLTQLKKQRDHPIESSHKENINRTNTFTNKSSNQLSFLQNLTSLTKSIQKPPSNLIMPVNTLQSNKKAFLTIHCK